MKNRNEQSAGGLSADARKLEDELCAYEQSGWVLRLNGKISSPHRVRIACFREKGNYMRDFVWDADRETKELHFIRVRDR